MTDAEYADRMQVLEDLKVLKGTQAYTRTMQRNELAIEFLMNKLVATDATDAVAVGKIQAEVGVHIRMRDEYLNCEKMIFMLAKEKNPDITDGHDSGLVPPD